MGRDYYTTTFDDYVVQVGLTAQLADLDAQITSATQAGDTHLVSELTFRRTEWVDNAKAEHAKVTDYRPKRVKEYPPVTDQLDAILKQMVKLQQAGIALDADMADIVSKWQAVKTKYPKPVK